MDPFKGEASTDLISWLDRFVQDINLLNWQIPTLLNSWADASGYQGARYRKDLLKQVHIQGRIDTGTDTPGTVLFTLPVGSRPSALLSFVAHSNSAIGLVEVQSDGDVVIRIGNNASLDLNTIKFAAEQ